MAGGVPCPGYSPPDVTGRCTISGQGGTPSWGTPHLELGYSPSESTMGWRWGNLPVDRQTLVKTVPSRRTTSAGGKNIKCG